MFGDFFFDGGGVNVPDIHALAQPGDGDDLVAADLVAATHLNFAHREIAVVDNKIARRAAAIASGPLRR